MSINFLNIIQVLIAIALIGFILIQRGPGATAGSAFGGGGGGGASGTVFGAKGSGSFLSKTTALLATAFFIITLLMAVDAKDSTRSVEISGDQDLGVMGTLIEDQSSDIPTISGSIDDNSDVPVIDQISQEVDPKLTEVNDQLEQIEEDAAVTVDEAADDDSGDKQ